MIKKYTKMDDIKKVIQILALRGIKTSMQYNIERNQCYVDLLTEAKSELHLYEDGMLRGRYEYETLIDLTQDTEILILDLCHEFNHALCGRDYYQKAWGDLCQSKGIALNIRSNS